jgi:hypothetical protein
VNKCDLVTLVAHRALVQVAEGNHRRSPHLTTAPACPVIVLGDGSIHRPPRLVVRARLAPR